MKKFLTLTAIFCTLVVSSIASAAAQVTDARWGVNADNVLRLVVDLNGSATYKIKLSDQNKLNIIVDAAANTSLFKETVIRSSLANSMRVYEEGAQTVVELNLTKYIKDSDYKSFVLKTDPRNGRPNRIVLDVTADKKVVSAINNGNTVSVKSVPVATNTQPANDRPVVSTKPTNKRPAIIKSPSANSTPTTNTVPASSTEYQKQDNSNNDVSKPVVPITVKKPVDVTQTDVKPVDVKPVVTKPADSKQTDVKPVDKRSDAKENAKESAQKNQTSNTVKRDKTSTSTAKKENGIPAIKATKKYSVSGGIKGKTIVLDAGHGGSDPGAIGASGLKEKDVTLPITKLIKKELEDKGAKVYMTRNSDVDVCKPGASDRDELQARVNVAEKNNCDAFISIHINASVNKKIGGFSAYYHPKTSYDLKLARLIQNKLAKNFSVNDLGVREAGFYVIKRSSMPATLLELCFITNAREEKLMQSTWFRKKAASLIADGVEEYFK